MIILRIDLAQFAVGKFYIRKVIFCCVRKEEGKEVFEHGLNHELPYIIKIVCGSFIEVFIFVTEHL